MFTDFDLAFEKTLWDFSFICLAQGSFTSVVYAAPFWGGQSDFRLLPRWEVRLHQEIFQFTEQSRKELGAGIKEEG